MPAAGAEIGFGNHRRPQTVVQYGREIAGPLVKFRGIAGMVLAGMGIGGGPTRPLAHALLFGFEQVAQLLGGLLGREALLLARRGGLA